MQKITVVLADDHPYLRRGVRAGLEATPDITVVGEAADGAEALQLVQEMTPNVLLLDIQMPKLTGIEVARRLQAMESPVRVVMFSAHNEASYVRGCMRLGVAGYILKDDNEDLTDVIRRVASGETACYSRSIITELAQQPRPKAPPE